MEQPTRTTMPSTIDYDVGTKEWSGCTIIRPNVAVYDYRVPQTGRGEGMVMFFYTIFYPIAAVGDIMVVRNGTAQWKVLGKAKLPAERWGEWVRKRIEDDVYSTTRVIFGELNYKIEPSVSHGDNMVIQKIIAKLWKYLDNPESPVDIDLMLDYAGMRERDVIEMLHNSEEFKEIKVELRNRHNMDITFEDDKHRVVSVEIKARRKK